jgi:hypothetical protein
MKSMRLSPLLSLAALAALITAAPGVLLRPAFAQAVPAGASPEQKPDLTAGRLHLTLDSGAKMRLWVDGVQAITESHLYLVKPGWSGILLNTDEMKPRLTTSTEGDTRVLTAEFDNPDAYARYRFELSPRNTLTVRLTFGTKNGVPAEVEYSSYLNANPVIGAAFEAETTAGGRTGKVPMMALSENQEASRLTPALFRRMRLDSLLGPLTIQVDGNNRVTSALNLFDARKGTQDWATRHPILWLGIGSPSLPIPAGENTLTITYTFGPAPRRTTPTASPPTDLRVMGYKDARVPYTPDRPIIPKPKEMTSGDATRPLRLSERTRIVLPASPIPQERQGAEELRTELQTFWGLKVPVLTGEKPRPGDITLGRAEALGATAPDKPEGYLVRVDSGGAMLAGKDARGVYNAAQTLKQLLRVDGSGVYLKPVTIRDWPTLLWRGVHWYGGPQSYPFHERMIDRILAPLKYNEMVYQAEYTEWDSQPKLRDYRSTPKAEVRKTIAYARAHFFEPIPLVPSLGHMEWMFLGGQNLDIAADPTHPYSIDPENPRSYEALFGIYQEVIDLFQPRWFHIGHDEVTMVGTFPRKGSTRSITDLYVQNVRTIHDYLGKKSITPMMWGDMMLHSTEGSGGAAFAPTKADAATRRAGVPKDTLITDWHYSGPEYPSVEVLQNEGFGTLVSTWYDPANIRDFAREAARQKSRGLLQTTWAGYAMSLDLIKGESLPQFIAYLIGAEHAWNGGANGDFDALGYDPGDAFLTLWNRQPTDRSKRPGFAIDLSPLANAERWAWSPGATGTIALPSGDTRLGGVRFMLRRPVWMAGALNPAGDWPSAVTIPLGKRRANSLEWLWGTALPAPLGTTVARVAVTYADGRVEETPVVYGRDILAFSDRRSGAAVRTLWTGPLPNGDRATVRAWTWKNPRLGVPLVRVTVTSEGTEGAPILLGLTGLE